MTVMKLARLVICLAFAAPAAWPVAAAEFSSLFAEAAKYESGRSAIPLRRIEQLIRDTAGQAEARASIEAALAGLLGDQATFEAQRFACQQLAVIGTEMSLPAIAKLLENDQTVGIGCIALGSRRSKEISDILRQSLRKSQGRARLQLIGALANQRNAGLVPLFAELAREENPSVAGAAIIALARLQTDAARAAISEVRRTASPAVAPAVIDALFQSAEQLAAAGNAGAATALLEEMLATAHPVQIRRGALDVLLRMDPDGGERRIISVLRGTDDALKPVAIAAISAVESPGASAKFAKEMAGVGTGEKILIIRALAQRGDAPARDAIRMQLDASEPRVRLAAIKAAGTTGGPSLVPRLNGMLLAADLEERAALTDALVALGGGENTDRAIADELGRAPEQDRPLLLEVLANRNSQFAIGVLVEATADRNLAVSKVAFRALGRLAGREELPVMLDRLGSAPSPDHLRAAEVAVARVLSGVEEAQERSDILRERLRRTHDVETRSSLLRLLQIAGNSDALSTLLRATMDEEERIADAAVRTLARWPDPAASDRLLAIYRNPRSEAHRVLALRGLVRLAREENRRPTAALIERYRQLLGGAKDDDDRRLLLGALAGVAHPDALSLALPLLSDAAIRPEAVLAVRQIAASIKTQHPEAAHAALVAEGAEKPDVDVERADSHLKLHRAGRHILTYNLQPPADSGLPLDTGGFFHPLKTPSGVVVTDLAPSDHKHHRGVFLAWVEMHGAKDADFWGWGRHAPIEGRRIVNRTTAARGNGFTASNDWLAEDTVLVSEVLEAVSREDGGAWLLDLVFRIKPRSDLVLSQQAFGGFCVRGRKEGDIRFHSPTGAVDLPNPSHLKPETDWPDAPWYGCEQTLPDGTRFGVTVMNHPSNPLTLWHNNRNLRMINPAIVAPSAVELKAGEDLVLRYRVVTFDGALSIRHMNAIAEDFSSN